MTRRLRIASGLLVLAMICAPTVGYAAAAQSSLYVAYCVKLYGLWNRYGNHPTFHHTGQRARAELALHRCERGSYHPAIDVLDVMLVRNLLAIPPAPQIAETPRY